MSPASLDLLFRPRGVAVIGASADPRGLGHRIVCNLIDARFAGGVYPVHPRGGEIEHLPIHQSVQSLPDDVTLAVVCVPRDAVLDVVEQCARRGIGAIVVVSAGFGETGDEGASLQQLLAAAACEHGARVVGPNCVGVINTDPAVRLNTTFCPLTTSRGNVALCSQSGALGVLALAKGDAFGVGFSQFISVGNEADVSTAEVLEYWLDDEHIGAVLLYLESIAHGARFRESALRMARRKPIIAIKAGRDEAGQRAARSHTAALTSNESAIDALFRQTGIVRAEGLDEMLDLAALFAHQPPARGRRVAILTNAGGPAVLCADACARAGLEVPELSSELRARLADFIAPPASTANPVDMLASAGPAEYRQAAAALVDSDEVDAVVVVYVPVEMVANPDFVEAINAGVAEGRSTTSNQRTVVACVMSKSSERIRLATAGETIPCCIAPDDAARVLAKAAAYEQWRRESRGETPRLDGIDSAAARRIAAAGWERSDDGWLPAEMVLEFADAVGLPMLAGEIARTGEVAVDAARGLGFPVALKTASAEIRHKTDIGAVELRLDNEDEVRAAFERILRRVAAQSETGANEGVLVQPMCAAGVELMIGATRDPQLGPTIAFGLGGTNVEILGGVGHGLAPLKDREVHNMVRSMRGYPLLAGYRGQPPADVPAIEQLLLRVSQFVADLPEVAELDLNPVVALPVTQGCRIVDARIRVQAPSGE